MDLLEKIYSLQDDLRSEVNSRNIFYGITIICLSALVLSISVNGLFPIAITGVIASLFMVLKCKVGIGSLCIKIEELMECYKKEQDYVE